MPTQTLRKTHLSRVAIMLFGAAGLLAATAVRADDAVPEAASGPDVTVFQFTDIGNYGNTGGIVGYSVGTRSCNRGTTPLNWCDQASGCAAGATTHDHPVIAQNLYRLKDGRLDQIGMSWLKHGFLSTNSTTAGCTGAAGGSCVAPPAGSNQLGVGCTDPYTSSLNGGRPLGMRSEVNGTTGAYPFPFTSVGSSGTFEQRIKVLGTDVDSTLNPGAMYFAEAQYIAPDDAAAGNALNNASYRRVTVGAGPNYPLTMTGTMFEQLSAINAWPVADPTVTLSNSDFCSAPVERFEVARKVTDLGSGTWHYEYAVRNHNSDHAAQRFSVDLPDGTSITNVGFHDIDFHSGEPYSTTDWTPLIDGGTGTVSWSTETYATNNNANALRWATMFNFWFDATAAPETAQHSIDLFKPLPEAIANAGPAVGICLGDSVQIGTAAVAGQTYSWSPGGATTALVSVSPASTTVYTVTATNRCDSSQSSVTVTVDPGPDAPTLVGPADGSVGLAPPVALSWNAAVGAADYTYEIATDAGFTSIVQSATVAATGANVTGLPSGAYFWRVTANGTCSGAPSATFGFTVTNALFSDGFESNSTAAWSLAFP